MEIPENKRKKTGTLKNSKKIEEYFGLNEKTILSRSDFKRRMNLYRSRPPAGEAGTSIGLNPGVSVFKNVFRMFLKKEYVKKVAALITIIAVIITAYFQNAPQSQSAAYSWM